MSWLQKKAFHDGGSDTAAQPFSKVGSQKRWVKNENIWRNGLKISSNFLTTGKMLLFLLSKSVIITEGR